jgi:DNA-binding XRE family transcriptional regulator
MYKSDILYPNLEAELARAGIDKKELAKVIGKSKNTLYSRLNGKTELTLSEARIIKAYVERKTGRIFQFTRLFNINE